MILESQEINNKCATVQKKLRVVWFGDVEISEVCYGYVYLQYGIGILNELS